MITCSVVGATGYTGLELIRILAVHPRVKIVHLTTRSDEKLKASSLVPSLGKLNDYTIESKSMKQVAKDSDVVFLALPHTSAMDVAKEFLKAGKIVIDLSADFRLKNPKVYEEWYGLKHTQHALLKRAIYGLPEVFRDSIVNADFISNPGCYPTSINLALYPLLKQKLIHLDGIVIDSKSGVSGAGKKLSMATHFSETHENFSAYKVNRHQHMPEIAQTLSAMAGGSEVQFSFVPHLLPVNRGILSTIYVQRKPGVKPAQIAKAFEEIYAKEPFVKFLGEDKFPAIKDVQYTNFCSIGIRVEEKSGQVIIISAIDNLVKGASGQAVQNMNIRLRFSEETALI